MKVASHIVLASAARLCAPLIALFALTLLVARAPGTGVGFTAGLAVALVLVLHALVFGAAAARAAFPAWVGRVVLVAGLVASIVAAGAPRWAFAPQVMEAGLFAATTAAGALIIAVLFGRAPTLRDAEW